MDLLRDISEKSPVNSNLLLSGVRDAVELITLDMSNVMSVLQHLCVDAWAKNKTLGFDLPANLHDNTST